MRLPSACLIVLVAVGLGAGSALANDLSQTIQKANHLIVLNELAVTTDQLAKLAPLTEQLVAAVQARNADRQRLLAEAAPTLEAARQALVSGAALNPGVETALDKLEKALEDNDDKLEETAVDVMADIEKEFFPQQNRYIDWTPPHQVTHRAPVTSAAEAQREREQTALLLATTQQLERIRMLPEDLYIFQYHKMVVDYLRPLIDPRSPEYPAAEDFMLKLVAQVRMMRNDEWDMRREEMAEILVRRLGLIDEPQQGAEQPKPYNWQSMYAIFSDLGAPDLLKELQEARATTAGGAEQ